MLADISHLNICNSLYLSPVIRQTALMPAQQKAEAVRRNKFMMTTGEYKNKLKMNDVLDYTTLDITVKELASKKDFKLAKEIQRILRENKIEKPFLHNKVDEGATNYYKVDLSDDNIDIIRDMFLELEVSFVDKDGNTTPTASFYASLADKWFNIGENV